ncbi:hypothetical protein SSX86_007831 [Deinandra increscens subsp. villosa]|uniref:BED-type domain-containing protein n=1 Tax=Deinandra increscens subsp. villosa TaxID=3103831 RepID=A0AAP0DIT3_9ASTR
MTNTTSKSKSKKSSSSKDSQKAAEPEPMNKHDDAEVRNSMDVEDLSSDSNGMGYEEGTEEDNVSDDKPTDKQAGQKRKYKQRPKKAECWKYFGKQFKDKDGKIKARCNFCNKKLAADSSRNGTHGLNRHYKNCESNPNNLPKEQPQMSAQQNGDGQTTLTAWKFDPAKDKDFRKTLDVVPDSACWRYANKSVELLKLFCNKTREVSCSTYAIAHEHYSQVKDISHNLVKLSKTCVEENTSGLKKTLENMNEKFAKYFEVEGKNNQIFEFAVILDPRFKLDPIRYACIEQMEKTHPSKNDMSEEELDEYKKILDTMVGAVTSEMQLLVTEYEKLYQTGPSIAIKKENVGPIRPGRNSWMSNFESRRQALGQICSPNSAIIQPASTGPNFAGQADDARKPTEVFPDRFCNFAVRSRFSEIGIRGHIHGPVCPGRFRVLPNAQA